MFRFFRKKDNYFNGHIFEEVYTCSFNPKEDITPYELARIVRGFRGFFDPQEFKITKSKYDNLGYEITRHFRTIRSRSFFGY